MVGILPTLILSAVKLRADNVVAHTRAALDMTIWDEIQCLWLAVRIDSIITMIVKQLKGFTHGNSQIGASTWRNIGHNIFHDFFFQIGTIIDWIGKGEWNLDIIFVAKEWQCQLDSTGDELSIPQLIDQIYNVILEWMGNSVDRSNLSFYPSFPLILWISDLMSHPRWIKNAKQWLHVFSTLDEHSQFDIRLKSASFRSHVASLTTAREP